MSLSQPVSRNIPLFVAFRVFFNARWYYPVLAVLMLDLGISLEQYALLNVAWAASILLFEVPSGALADQIGRRRMVVLASGLMVLEQLLLAFAPKGVPWLFGLLLLNRILSGAAEACASGADEALAYDSLPEQGRQELWSAVLGRVMRWQSAGFFLAMMGGAALYDAQFLENILGLVGWHGQYGQLQAETTMRFPLYLTVCNAVLALAVSLRMREPAGHSSGTKKVSVRSTVAGVVSAGRWIWATPVALMAIVAGCCLDSVLRLFLTLASNYYRLIQLPEASFGLIGSGMALVGFGVPRLASRVVRAGSLGRSFAVLWILGFVGLGGIAMLTPVWGVLWLLPLGMAMSGLGFVVSYYLNESVTDTALRATVLSFKGLFFNLGYGAMGLAFAGLGRVFNGANGANGAISTGAAGGSDLAFGKLLALMPCYVALSGVLLWMVARWKNRCAASHELQDL